MMVNILLFQGEITTSNDIMMIFYGWFYQVVIYGRDPNWGRIACAAGCVGIFF